MTAIEPSPVLPRFYLDVKKIIPSPSRFSLEISYVIHQGFTRSIQLKWSKICDKAHQSILAGTQLANSPIGRHLRFLGRSARPRLDAAVLYLRGA